MVSSYVRYVCLPPYRTAVTRGMGKGGMREWAKEKKEKGEGQGGRGGGESCDSPTCGPSGVLIRMMDPAGAVHARPERMGSTKSSRGTGCRGADWISAYSCLSTLSGEDSDVER